MSEIEPPYPFALANSEIAEDPVEATPGWIIQLMYRIFMDLNSINNFLEKWGCEAIVDAVIPWLPQEIDTSESILEAAETSTPDWLTDQANKMSSRKKQKKHHKKQLQERELALGESITLRLDDSTLEAKLLLTYRPFKSKKLFNYVSPQLQIFVNRRLARHTPNSQFQVSHIRFKKDQLFFTLTRHQ